MRRCMLPRDEQAEIPFARRLPVGLKTAEQLAAVFGIIKPFFGEVRKRIPKEKGITLQSNRRE